MSEQDLILQAINAMEAQRATLGDAIVNPAIAALRDKLSRASGGQRKQVTVLFADLVGFTAMAERMDAEQVGDLLREIWKHLDALIIEYGGWINKHIGDAVLAVWGATESQESDPEQAVHAALALQTEIRRLAEERNQSLQMRVAVHTGLVYVTPGDTSGELNITGMPVQLAESIQHAAPPGRVLITQDTLIHIRGIFNIVAQEPLVLKEIPNPMQVHLVNSARPRAFRMGTRGIEGIETNMIGRDQQLLGLQQHFNQVISTNSLRLVTISAEVGVGKSRLLFEFEKWVENLSQRVRYFKGRAGLDMRRAPFSLLRDVFALRFQILDTDNSATVWSKVESGVAESLEEQEGKNCTLYAHFIGHLIGFDFSQSPLLSGVLSDSRQIFNRGQTYMAKYFQGLCLYHPVMILLEDIQWADDASLQVIQYLVSKLAKYPVLIVCTARPTFFERAPQWENLGQRIDLEPLPTPRARELVRHILQKVSLLPENLIDLIITGTQGNPFYIEELIKMLIEDQVILKGEETWQVNPTRLRTARVPSTLTGVLQSRLDSLLPQERHAMQCAAIVGSVFWEAAVEYLIHQSERPGQAYLTSAEEIVSSLRKKEMVFRRETSAFAGTLEYIFKNAMLREVTYESIPKRDRRLGHAQAATWLIQTTQQSGRQDEYARLIAEHLEAAGENQIASTWYARAAQQAAARFAIQEAIYCFSHALELTPEVNLSTRYELLAGREKMYDLQADRSPQMQDLQAISALAEQLPEARPSVQAALRSANYGLVTGNFAAASQSAETALNLAQAIPDLELQAQAALLWSQSQWRQSDYDAARLKLDLVLTLARKINSPALEAEALRNLGVIEEDQGNYPQAGTYYQQTLTLYQLIGDRVGEANTYSSLGNLAIDLNDHESSITYHQLALQLRRETGDRRGQARSLGNLGFIASDQGDYTASKDYFEQALQLFQQIEDRQGEAVALVNLGNDAMVQGNYPAALQYQQQALAIQTQINNRLGESIALDNLSLIHHYLGNQSEALEYADRALNIALPINLRHVLGYVYNHRGHALLELGHLERARSAYQKSLDLRRELGEHNLALESQAGLVQVHLAMGEIQDARNLANTLLLALQNTLLDGMVEPFRCYLTVYHALQAANDPQAVNVIETSRRLLLERAEKILDHDLRRSFLENVRAHRQILAMSAPSTPGE